MTRLRTLDDVLIAIERFEAALTTPRPRCPDGARKHQDEIDARKAELIEAARLYGAVESEEDTY